MRTPRFPWWIFVASAVLLQQPGRAAAVDFLAPVPLSPTRGVLIPAGPVAGDGDATSVELNPGQLGFIDGPSSALVVDYWDEAAVRPGRGAAAMVAMPLFLGARLAAGYQWLMPTGPDTRDYQKLQLAYGWRVGRALSLGAVWEHLYGGRYAGLDSFSVGAGLRLHRTVALAGALRDVNRPRAFSGGPRLRRVGDVELAVRPTGTDRVEIAAGARLAEAGELLVEPRARIAARVWRGVSLFAAGELWDAAAAASDGYAYRVMAGLQIDSNFTGLTGATILDGVSSGSAGEAGDHPGSSLVLRAHPLRRQPLMARRHARKVKLDGLETETRYLQTYVELRRMIDDAAIGAVVLEIDRLDLGLARIEELRGLVAALRAAGKPVFARLQQPSTREYYLASACDRVVLDPGGALTLGGLGQTVVFYKGALDKLGVNVDLVRIAEYKGAMEPYVMTEHSEPVRQNRNALLDDAFGRMVQALARDRADRGLGDGQVRALVDQAFFSPTDAVAAKLVDAVSDEDGMDEVLSKSFGRRVSLRDGAPSRLDPRDWKPPRVAIVLVEGAITEGRPGGLPDLTGGEVAFSEPIIEALEAVKGDPSVRAVVLRVNSPGGSAYASDLIARAVADVRKAGKPVVVSMSDVAASGGYFVSARADAIYASPSTTTGSIGIFGAKVDGVALLDKLGITTEVYTRGAHADLYSPFRAWTDDERALVTKRIQSFYQRFLDTIAEGRKAQGITAARADELGRGRVYTGAQALGVKLVDRLGDIGAAIDDAVARAEIPVGQGGLPELVVLPRRAVSPLQTLMQLQGGRAVVRLLAPVVVAGSDVVQARLPYELEVR